MPLAETGQINIGQMMQFALEKLGEPGADQAVHALEKLVELHRTMQHDDSIKNFNRAFARMQSTLPDIPKCKSVSISGGARFDFAPLETIMPKIRPVLQENGLAVYFTEVPAIRESSNTRTRCTLVHIDGHSIYSESEAPPDNKNTMSNMHKSGGSNSFTARYALLRVLGIVPMDADAISDSLAGEPIEPITEEQRKTIENKIAKFGVDLERFVKYLNVESIANIPANRFEEANALLEKKKGASK